MTKIEWVRGEDGSQGMSWNALRAERTIERNGKPKTASANHCEHVNEACRFCYAERMNARLGGLPFKPGHRKDYRFFVDQDKLTEPLRKRKPTRIFVESMSDAFGDWWPDEFIDQLYAVMALTPQHTYINLSKRPERRRKYLEDRLNRGAFHIADAAYDIIGIPRSRSWHPPQWLSDCIQSSTPKPLPPLPNVIEGTSVSCQPEADEFVPIVLQTKAALRGLSCEPLLGPINLRRVEAIPDSYKKGKLSRCGIRIDALTGTYCESGVQYRDDRLNWVIVGGESGQNARPMHPQWARDIRDQCAAAGVAFFFKQWGLWRPSVDTDCNTKNKIELGPEHDGYRPFMTRVKSKEEAGRLLDGRTHDEFPVVKIAIGEAA
jgi:protein gp37